jgi:hypothetical protein
MKSRYIEKSTGRWWSMSTYIGDIDGKGAKVKLCDYDNGKEESDWLSMEEFKQRFDNVPWPKPKVVITPIGLSAKSPAKQRIYVQLFCPECGSPLSYDGSCYPTSPLQFPHKCSNPNCKYEKTISSVHHGMFADATEAQIMKLEVGTYNEREDDRLENRGTDCVKNGILLDVHLGSVKDELEYYKGALEAVERKLSNPKFRELASDKVVALNEKRRQRIKEKIAELEAGAK